MSLLLWARLWSPVVPAAESRNAWRELNLSADCDALQAEFIRTFHHGAPAPKVSLLLHHSLNLTGDGTREDWMRAMAWLDLQYGDIRLPPDHLAVACEVLAVAEAREEAVLSAELTGRYLLPWCEVASERLRADASPLLELPRSFARALSACGNGSELHRNRTGSAG